LKIFDESGVVLALAEWRALHRVKQCSCLCHAGLDPASIQALSCRTRSGIHGVGVRCGAAGGNRQRLILWRSSLRYDFAKRLGLGTAP
jgi:hypothetical protein